MEIHEQSPTAPFGTGRISFDVVRTQQQVNALLPGKSVNKWQLFRHICIARSQLGVSDRALTVLEALLTFHRETLLASSSSDLVVYPSNRKLIIRAHGIAPSTLRRQLASLIKAGLILRRDSPNGKRYARRDASGHIDRAFGFDLSPLIVRAAELADLSYSIAEDGQLVDRLRKQATLSRRDIGKMIETGIEENIDADWPAIRRQFGNLTARLPRIPSRESLEPVVRELTLLASHILEILQQHVHRGEAPEVDAADAPDLDSCVKSKPRMAPTRSQHQANVSARSFAMPVRLIIEACPDIVNYARGDIRTIGDLVAAARLARQLLAVSPSAWNEACTVMGEEGASLTLAVILQRGDSIKNAGGYLRTLTRRAAAGELSIWPLIMALRALNQKRKLYTQYRPAPFSR
ncbi:plasmid replication protein RepC [Bradyrhizobium sp. Leo121]|uniref:plasmid replication protein RepC n=1 Tax=Bradyrhizobium sp. Leo121 TaxID=1571195 RepID=UPI001029EB0F|nr:plasmid replication protein RepC [Bradyrhizobium sp. Leo121]RZN12099.1 replication protein C [Bradyrhizobium sp. Leo121]